MSFAEMKTAGGTWCESGGTHFTLTSTDESERKLTFGCGDISFDVTCPCQATDESWHVWSDNEKVVAKLQDTLDFISSGRKKTLTDVLNHVNKSLAELVGGNDDEMDEDDDDDDFGDAYYEEEDVDAETDQQTRKDVTQNEQAEAEKFFTGEGSAVAVQRLLKDLKMLSSSKGKFGVVGTPDGDNLFHWNVQLTDFDKKTPLGRDLTEFAKKYHRDPVVYMEMKFPKEYPMAPPFVRVVRPRFKFLTGHVTIGGSVCMEMLTRSGWRPTNDIESILVQIRAEIMSDQGTRLDSNPDRAYDEAEAKHAFERMVQRYGWNK